MADQQAARRSPSFDLGIPDALVEAPDLGRASVVNLFRSRNPLAARPLPGSMKDGRTSASTHVAVLPVGIGRDLSLPPQSAVADRAQPEQCGPRLRRAAVSSWPRERSIYAASRARGLQAV